MSQDPGEEGRFPGPSRHPAGRHPPEESPESKDKSFWKTVLFLLTLVIAAIAYHLLHSEYASTNEALDNGNAVHQIADDKLRNIVSNLRIKKDPVSRYNALSTLGFMGESAAQAVPDIAQVMKEDPSLSVRKEAAAALEHIGTPEALEALKRQ